VLDRESTRSAALLVIIGPAWEHLTNHDSQPRIRDADDVVRYEIATALDKRLLVIPVLWGAPRRLHPKPCRPSCSDCRACMRRWSISACVRETWSRSPSDSGRRAPLTSTNTDPWRRATRVSGMHGVTLAPHYPWAVRVEGGRDARITVAGRTVCRRR